MTEKKNRREKKNPREAKTLSTIITIGNTIENFIGY